MKFELVLTVPLEDGTHRKVEGWSFEVKDGKVKFIPSRREIKKATLEFLEKVE